MVEFKCFKKPDLPSLSGFELGKVYKGRAFNGVFQISKNWGGDEPTIMMEGRNFYQYFQLVDTPKIDIAA